MWYGWKPYVPVARRRANALKQMDKLKKKGIEVQPIEIEGRTIARTFWGKAWCDHLESFSDYENRLPRGRTYVRNGSVCHLEIAEGKVKAIVSGSELYNVKIDIQKLPKGIWQEVKQRCSGRIGSLLELLQGKLSDSVMAVVTNPTQGLFPSPKEISLACSCPDWAVMCKHVAAVLYGVGARLDHSPELLFRLRGVDHEELVPAHADVLTATSKGGARRRQISGDALAGVFGIDLAEEEAPAERPQKGGEKSSNPKTVRVRRTPKASRRRRESPIERGERTEAVPAAPPATNGSPVTATTVAKLRKRFGMTPSQFARLLGVSPPSIANWENRKGPLNLRARTLEALRAAENLARPEAWRRLKLGESLGTEAMLMSG